MKLKIVLLCMVLMVMVSCVSAFPLTGGNGQVNASVLGTMPGQDVLYIDIIGSSHLKQVTLVDSEDKFYDAGAGQNIGELGDSSDRNLYYVQVPANAEIKRIRITPDQGDPFLIEWTGVPEVNDSLIGMKFYGLTTESEWSWIKTWLVDVKVTNSGSQKQRIDGTKFKVVDQFGFSYTDTESDFKPLDLMPGESARIVMKFKVVSALSRPVYLTYLPSNLTMDISAWA